MAGNTGAVARPSPGLREIKDIRVRNLVRGALTSENETVLTRTMESLRRECDAGDALIAFRVLQASRLAHNLVRPSAFPDSARDIDKIPFFAAGPLRIELAAYEVQIEQDPERLCASIRLVGELNRSILKQEVAGAANLFDLHVSGYGISLMVAMKAMSVRHSTIDEAARKEHARVIAPFLSPRRQVAAVAFEDSIDPERDYIQVRRSFLKFVGEDRLAPADRPLIVDLFSPLAEESSGFSQRLQAYGRWSLLDSTAYLMRLRQTLALSGQRDDLALVDAAIPVEVRDAWGEAFSDIDLPAFQDMFGGADWFGDLPLLAQAAAWSEYEEIFAYRLRVEQAVGPRLDGQFPPVRRHAASFMPPAARIEDLLISGYPDVGIHSTSPSTCGVFHRTIGLISSLENGGLADFDGEALASLLDQTIDVPSLITRDELNLFLPRRPSDLLYEYLRAALTEDLESNKVSNHALRRALERLVNDRFDGDIVGLLKHVDTPLSHVAGHLYYICTEAFLTELYGLYTEADQVTEAQASILEWRAARSDDEDARLRARSHRLNLRLRKVRGAIEETRIYVDPLRFTQWVHEHVGGELRTLSSQVDDILSDPDPSISLKDPLRNTVQPRLKLLKQLDRCYAEFCTNKIYGVTSFIGRRIRHGTFHGHLVLEVQPEVQRAIDEFRYCAPAFASFLEDWLVRFDAAVVEMVADQIHVRSKEKPKGLIVATVDEADKLTVVNLMLSSVADSLSESTQIAKTIGLIREYCWLLFEVDLKRAREAVERLRRSFAINPEDHTSKDPALDRRIRERVRALNSTMHQKFEGVRSWFTRPTALSPSASVALLFDAVLDEVRQRHPNYDPVIDRDVLEDIDLIGHRFHFFYDALYILVHNAARHGRKCGKLKVEARLRLADDDKYANLSVSITSDLDQVSRAENISRIEQAMEAEIGDAMIANKKSGIRKLRGLVEDVEEIVGFERDYNDQSVVFTIRMRYPRS